MSIPALLLSMSLLVPQPASTQVKLKCEEPWANKSERVVKIVCHQGPPEEYRLWAKFCNPHACWWKQSTTTPYDYLARARGRHGRWTKAWYIVTVAQAKAR